MESYFIFLDMKIKYIQSNASFTKEKLKRKKYGINRAVKLKQKHSWRTLMTKSESYNVACNSWSRTRNKRSLRSRKNNLDGFKKKLRNLNLSQGEFVGPIFVLQKKY